MDQGPLVIDQFNAALTIDQINAGTAFIDRLDEHLPVKAAFWLKASDEGRWYLYIASDKIKDATKKEAYAEVLRVAAEMGNPNLDPFRVKLIGSGDPLAQAAVGTHKLFAARVPTCFKGSQFGGLSVEEACVYPPPPYGADAAKWRGVWIAWWPDSSRNGACWVEFRREPVVLRAPWTGPMQVPRPAHVLVKDGEVMEYRPPEKAVPHLTQIDYEKKALEVVIQAATRSS